MGVCISNQFGLACCIISAAHRTAIPIPQCPTPYLPSRKSFKSRMTGVPPSLEVRRAEDPDDHAVLSYKPLRDDEIRLVHILPSSKPHDIHCTMSIHANYFQGTVQYTALSYCWGNVNVTTLLHSTAVLSMSLTTSKKL